MDLRSAVAGVQQQALMLQAALYPRRDDGPEFTDYLTRVTGQQVDNGQIRLPYDYPNGTAAYLGDPDIGYPPGLYPNFTYADPAALGGPDASSAQLNGKLLDTTSAVLLGPMQINETFGLASVTLPVINNTSADDILGWITAVVDARLLFDVLRSPEGLDNTGETLLIGPTSVDNHFPDGFMYYDVDRGSVPNNIEVAFQIATPRDNIVERLQLAPARDNSSSTRNHRHAFGGDLAFRPFTLSDYPAVQEGLTATRRTVNNAGSMIATHNEEGVEVSVGFAVLQSHLCDWILLIEQARSEVWAPIRYFRALLLGCVFGTVGFVLIFAMPLAHFSSRPIRRLGDATRKTVEAPGMHEDESDGSSDYRADSTGPNMSDVDGVGHKEGFLSGVKSWASRGQRKSRQEREEELKRRTFRIPGKVKDRKHIIQDELTDLTSTFNAMTDELLMQYDRLEERVKQRTAELELSKKVAEEANEAKTLFIANISHELKTPLNGILGMCAVCMQEEDPTRIRRSLGIIYKSGDLLLNLLTDLLTFSKNQVGQQLLMNEKEFRLRDVSNQIKAIFERQANESGIDLRISYHGPADEMTLGDYIDRKEYGPIGFGRLKDMYLWGDLQRVSQVVINLVSNALKFTPSGGSVDVRIRCLGEAEQGPLSRQESFMSRQSSQHSARASQQLKKPSPKRRKGLNAASNSTISLHASPEKRRNAANEINALARPDSQSMQYRGRDSSSTPPPNSRVLVFEFEVEDTGPGIAEDQQQKIFEPFVQGDLGLSKKYGGTGLGLSICQQLATLMKGTIALKSQQGVGSTFTMRIPLRHIRSRTDSTASSNMYTASRRNSEDVLSSSQPANSTHLEDGAPSQPARGGGDKNPRLVGLSQPFLVDDTPMDMAAQDSSMAVVERATNEAAKRGDKVRVLVAEDNKVNQEVVLRMLKLEDIYNVEIANNGQEALDRVKESIAEDKPFDLVFMVSDSGSTSGSQNVFRLIPFPTSRTSKCQTSMDSPQRG